MIPKHKLKHLPFDIEGATKMIAPRPNTEHSTCDIRVCECFYTNTRSICRITKFNVCIFLFSF